MSEYEYKLSAVVLVYNGEKYLRPCLDSLVNQTLDDLEIILVNDASTDDSLSICLEYARDYDNVRIIDKEINEGLATSANLGIREAKGKYVILVDNDDIIPSYAYEKLYDKACETDADICIGKANLIHGRYQNEINDYERNVWEMERTIHDPEEFPTLFHDAFYWNKIMKKSLIVDNDIKLPTGAIYADRKFSHTAYTYAKTISIIPDCVYLWRIRKHNKNDRSLSMKRLETWNYINRIDSYELDLDHLTNYYKNYFKILMRRVIVPIKGILDGADFEEVFFNRGGSLLKRECEKLDNVYDNDLSNIDNIYIYLILNEFRTEIKKLLKLDLKKEDKIINENGKSYWNLPIFRNLDVNVPDELFEIKNLLPQFFKINHLITDDNLIVFDEIEIPKNYDIKKGEILFIGRTSPYDVLDENYLSFEIEKVEDDNRNLYHLEIPIEKLNTFEIYDIFFKAEYEDKLSDKFRIPRFSIKKITDESTQIQVATTINNNMSIASELLNKEFNIVCDAEKLKLLVKEGSGIKNALKLYLKNTRTGESTRLLLNSEKSAYELEWKFFLDKKSNYKFFLTVFDDVGRIEKNIPLNETNLYDFKETTIKTNDNVSVNISANENGDIRLNSN